MKKNLSKIALCEEARRNFARRTQRTLSEISAQLTRQKAFFRDSLKMRILPAVNNNVYDRSEQRKN